MGQHGWEPFGREAAIRAPAWDGPAGGVAGPRLGLVGGGQLAKMLGMAALQLGCEVVVLDRSSPSPAMPVASHALLGDWDDPATLLKLASQVDVVSIENEFLDPDALATLEKAGHALYPGTATLRRIQDKFLQKQLLSEIGLKTAPFAAVASPAELVSFGEARGWPIVLKTRRNGYDGKGNFTVRGPQDANAAWDALQGSRNALYAEAFCDFAKELATIVTRGSDGSVAVYPVVETVQSNHVCHLVRAPAEVAEEITAVAAGCARRAVEAIDGVGSFGVEMFLTKDRQVLINELAPRVHNSGHYTIEACECSQFENHVRAVLGWPLGSTKMVAPAAVMVNVLGTAHGDGRPVGLAQALAVPGAHLHLYGKSTVAVGRKMGHVTALGKDLAQAEQTAQQAASLIGFGEAR